MEITTQEDIEKRVAEAVENFKSGFNCSQAVFAAFADLYGLKRDDALRISASFGGGIGRMRKTCGAACGMFLLAGLYNGSTDPTDKTGKAQNYELVQNLAEKFRKENGSITCAELLGLEKGAKTPPIPEERTKQYYAKRPCAKMVESAARIWATFLKETNK